MAALILVGGSAGDVLGRRRVYVASCAVLIAGSVICFAAPNLGVLVAGRVVQGVGAAGVTPISLALVDASFAEHERGRADRPVGEWLGDHDGGRAVPRWRPRRLARLAVGVRARHSRC